MESLKKNSETYYRYVEIDNESPYSTGNPVYEWVKTKNYTYSCVDEFSGQHYEDSPVLSADLYEVIDNSHFAQAKMTYSELANEYIAPVFNKFIEGEND